MPKTANLNLRLDSDLKKNAEAIYCRYGLSLPEAVTVFLHQSCNVGGLPFNLRPARPNAATLAAMAEAERITFDPSVKGYKDMNALFEDLDAEGNAVGSKMDNPIQEGLSSREEAGEEHQSVARHNLKSCGREATARE